MMPNTYSAHCDVTACSLCVLLYICSLEDEEVGLSEDEARDFEPYWCTFLLPQSVRDNC